jgi:nucleotide-binding universal stress UspA family protein
MKRVLLPHDGSPLSAAVVDALTPLLGAGIVVDLLHVRDGDDIDEAGVEKTAKWLQDQGVTVHRHMIASDDAAGAILDAVDVSRPDLVAMSTHGRSGVDRWVRGSVAERVLRACPAPLLMANPTVRTSTGFERTLLPLERPGSDAADEPLPVVTAAASLAAAHGGSVDVLHVDWNVDMDTPEQQTKRRAQRAEELSRAFAPVFAQLASAGVAGELRLLHGDTADRILSEARAPYDLIAMSTHGRSGPSRWLLGSVAEKVLRECRLPLLLVRST